MSILVFDLVRTISDLEGKNSKFRRIAFLRMATKNISVRFYRFPIKTVGGVRKSTKKCLKLTSLAPAPVEPKIGQPRNVCPEVTFSKIHLPYQFRDNLTSGKWSKSPDSQTYCQQRLVATIIVALHVGFFSVQGSLVDFNADSVRNLTRLIDMSLSGQCLRDATSRHFSRRIFRNDKNLAQTEHSRNQYAKLSHLRLDIWVSS